MFFPNIFFFVFFFSLSVYLCVSQQTLHTEQMEFVVDLSRSRFRFEFYVRHNSNATAHTLTFQKSNVEKNIFKRGENRKEKSTTTIQAVTTTNLTTATDKEREKTKKRVPQQRKKILQTKINEQHMKQLNDLNYLFALAAVTSDMRLSLSLSFNLMPTVRFKLNWRNFGFFVFTIKLLAALGSQLSFTVRESDGRCKRNTIHSLHSLHSFTCTHLAYTILSTHTLYSIPQQLLVYESFLRSGLNSALFEINWFLKPTLVESKR